MNLLGRQYGGIVPTVLALLALGAVPANAAVLLNVRADVASGRDARASLTFDGGVSSYRIYGNGSNDVSLVLLGTTRAPNAAASIAGKDSLKSITIDQLGDSIAVTFHAAAAADISLTNGNGQSLIAALHPSGSDAGDAFGGTPTAPTPAPAASGGAGAVGAGTLMEVVPLKYADVGEVVGLLVPGQQIASNDTFTPQEQNFGSGYGGGGGAGFGSASMGVPLASQSVSQSATAVSAGGATLGQQINENIGIDRRLNAIVLSGTQDVIDGYKAKIEKIDIPLSSVILETQIVELTDSAARDVGIDFTNAGGSVASGTFEIKTNTQGTGTIDLQAAVYAQIAKGEGRTIARPRIVAQNGSSAQILTGDALPIVTSIAVSGVNAVSQQVQYVNVGVSMQIQPRISSDGFVTSHLFSEVSSVTGYQQGYPTLSQREATTTATVKDGEPFVIGGLLQNDELRSLAKVPGIGDLPLIGWLFRVRHDQSKSTNLYIIVTPHILTNGNPVPAGVPSR